MNNNNNYYNNRPNASMPYPAQNSQAQMPMPIKYPKSLATAGRSNMIFSAQSNMRAMEQSDIDKGSSPLPTFKPWACLELSFADASKGTGGSGNVEIDHIADVKLRTAIAMKAVMEAEKKKAESSSEKTHAEDLMEIKVFYLPQEIRELKGKSAAEIAARATYDQVMKAAENLNASANRDPKYAENNRKQAQALRMAGTIAEARKVQCPDGMTVAELFSGDLNTAAAKANQLYNQRHPAGLLSAALYQLIQSDPSIQTVLAKKEEAVTGQVYKIYGPILKTPNVKKVDMQGYTKAYTLAVTCDPERTDYPFRVELTTMRGKPLPDRQVGVQGNTITDRNPFVIDLQSWEWINMIDRADWEKKMVEMMFHNTAYQIMLQADTDNYNSRQQQNMNTGTGGY